MQSLKCAWENAQGDHLLRKFNLKPVRITVVNRECNGQFWTTTEEHALGTVGCSLGATAMENATIS